MLSAASSACEASWTRRRGFAPQRRSKVRRGFGWDFDCDGEAGVRFCGVHRSLLSLLILLVAFASPGCSKSIRGALTSLCDPAKIATLTSERGANPRVWKIAYWLERARLDGRDPATEMREVMEAVGWGGTAKGELTAEAMVRNRTIAEQFGCLDEAGMADLRRGNAPTIRTGPYAGDQLSVDHIIPRSVCPELDTTLPKLELMPLPLNRAKSNSIGERQGALAVKFYAAGFLTDEAALRFYKAFEDSHYKTDDGFCGTPKVQRVFYLHKLEVELRRRGVWDF